VPVGPAQFDLNRCNESPLWGEKPDFWPVSKNNTGSLRYAAILPLTNNTKNTHTGYEPNQMRYQLVSFTVIIKIADNFINDNTGFVAR